MSAVDLVKLAQQFRSEIPEDADMSAILPWLVKNFPDATPNHIIKAVEIMDAMDRLDGMKDART